MGYESKIYIVEKTKIFMGRREWNKVCKSFGNV